MEEDGGRKIIRAGRLIDGTGAEPPRDMGLLIEGTRIKSIAPWSDALTKSATTYDFREHTILPGLVDAHCHLTLQGAGLTYEQEMRRSNEFMVAVAVHNSQVMLRSGVTTLRDNGSRASTMFEVRDAANSGFLTAPRMLLAGRPITPTGGHFHFCGGVADGAEDIRREIRRLVLEGADHIKIMASGGATVGTNPGLPSFSALELQSAVDVAHAYGRLTTAHCRARESIANAINAGLDCIEHAEFNEVEGLLQAVGHGFPYEVRWDPRLAERLASSGMFVSLTMPGGRYTAFRELRERLGHDKPSGTEQMALDQGQAMMEGRAHHVRRFLELGMIERIVISSDAGPFDIEFGKLYQGLEVAVAGGMTPMQALESCTRIAAKACGVIDQAGTLESGKEADILVTRGNPLDDIKELQTVAAVFKAGQVVWPSAALATQNHQGIATGAS